MPAAVPVVLAGVASGVTISGTLAAGITIGFSVGSALVGAALAAVSIALTPKPKQPSFDASAFQTAQQDRERSFRQPITTRKLAYGEIKAGGPLINVAATE